MFKKRYVNQDFVDEANLYEKYYNLFSQKQISLRSALEEAGDDTVKKLIIITAFSRAVHYINVHY